MKRISMAVRKGRCIGAACVAMSLLGLAGRSAAQSNNVEKIVVWVNGEYVTEQEFNDRLKLLSAGDFIASTNPLVLRREMAGVVLMNQIINERLILQWATKTKDLPTEEQVNEEFETQKKRPEIQLALNAKWQTDDFFKRMIRVQLARLNLATTSITVTPTEVEAFYKKNIASFTTPERWRMAVIRTRKADDLPKIQAELKAGKSFESLVPKYSDDASTNQKQGEVGVIAANDPTFPSAIKQAVKSMKAGEISAPVKIEVRSGPKQELIPLWFVIRLISRETEVVRPFSEVQKQCERALMLERAGGLQVADKKIADFRETAEIKITVPGYEGLLPKVKTPQK